VGLLFSLARSCGRSSASGGNGSQLQPSAHVLLRTKIGMLKANYVVAGKRFDGKMIDEVLEDFVKEEGQSPRDYRLKKEGPTCFSVSDGRKIGFLPKGKWTGPFEGDDEIGNMWFVLNENAPSTAENKTIFIDEWLETVGEEIAQDCDPCSPTEK
jgi:hypothetical protein